jgi:hypothetical protein
MYIPKNSILKADVSQLPPRAIFNEVCKLLGIHYADNGFSFFRSRPKMVKQTENFIIEIAFSSSHANMAGSYVCLEVIGSLYSKKLALYDKAQSQSFKGYVLGHSDFWNQARFLNNDQRTNCNFNIYAIDDTYFAEIVEYIDRIFLEQIDRMKNIDGIVSFINQTNYRASLGRENTRFYKFVELVYNNDYSIIDALKNKGILEQPKP